MSTYANTKRNPPKGGKKVNKPTKVASTQIVKVQKKKQNEVNNVKNSVRVTALRKEAISNGDLISPSACLVPADGVQTTIPVSVIFNVNAILSMPLGAISMGLFRGGSSPYSAYKVMLSDYSSIMRGGTGTAPSRLAYMNSVLGALAPKSVPYRVGNIAYKIEAFVSDPDNEFAAPSGYTYYMFEWDGLIAGWAVQVAPAPTTADQDTSAYSDFMNKLSGSQPHNTLVRDVALTKKYQKDVSPYARVSKYWGLGVAGCGPYQSVENEVPIKSDLLATFIPFNSTTARSARYLRRCSGDACSNWNLGVLNEFPLKFYEGAIPPIPKYLDIAELAAFLCFTLSQATSKYISSTLNIDPDDLSVLTSPFSFSYNVFLNMLVAQIKPMFNESQSLYQFVGPDDGPFAFTPFLCGSNCCPKTQPFPLIIPIYVNENLKCLKRVFRRYQVDKYQTTSNYIAHIPVWGAFQEYADPEFSLKDPSGSPILMFSPGNIAIEPNIWDGTTSGGVVIDINRSQNISIAAYEWNVRMKLVENMISGLDTIGGDSESSPFLQFTRAVRYEQIDRTTKKKEQELNERQFSNGFMSSYVRQEKELIRTTSTKKEERIKRVLAIPQSTLFTEFPLAITGIAPITTTHKQFLSQFILPVYDVADDDGIPSLTQVQSANMEFYTLHKNNNITNIDITSSRMFEIEQAIENIVIGLSGKRSQVMDFIIMMSKTNQGAFLGDLFSTIGNVANSIGFTGIGAIASTAGHLANTFNV